MRSAEVGAHAVAQAGGFAHINHLSRFIFEKIDPGLSG